MRQHLRRTHRYGSRGMHLELGNNHFEYTSMELEDFDIGVAASRNCVQPSQNNTESGVTVIPTAPL